MAIVKTRLSGCCHNLTLDTFLQLGYQIPVKLIIFLQKPKCKKFRCCLKSTSFHTKMSQKKVLTLFNDNPKSLFPCLAMILSLPIAKHSAYLVWFKQCLRRTLSK